MYIGLSPTNVVKLTDISRVSYDVNTNESCFHLNNQDYVTVVGRKYFDTYINFLTLSRNVLFIQDLIDRQENLDKIMTFHLSDPANNHEVIQVLDNADELIKKATEKKVARVGQLDFDFPIDSENILN